MRFFRGKDGRERGTGCTGFPNSLGIEFWAGNREDSEKEIYSQRSNEIRLQDVDVSK